MARWLNGRLPMGQWPVGRALTTVALLAAWVVVIAVGAGRAADAKTWLNLPTFDWVAYVLLALMILVAVMVFVSAIIFQDKDKIRPPSKRRSIWPLLILLVVFLALSQREPSDVAPALEDPVPPVAEEQRDDNPQFSVAPPGRGETAVLVVIAVTAAALALWARRGTEALTPVDEVPLDEALSPAIQRAAQQLTLGDDPRSSVLLAYDGLETMLARHGLPRGRSETPTEHMRQVLADRDQRGSATRFDPEPLLRLAGLYEVARFSQRPITSAEQRAAADSLRRVEDRMRTR